MIKVGKKKKERKTENIFICSVSLNRILSCVIFGFKKRKNNGNNMCEEEEEENTTKQQLTLKIPEINKTKNRNHQTFFCFS